MLLLGSFADFLEVTSHSSVTCDPHSQLNVLDIDGFDRAVVAC